MQRTAKNSYLYSSKYKGPELKLFRVAISIGCLILALKGYTQEAQLPLTANFVLYTDEDGLPDNAAYCIAQDTFGYMWVGTASGLARFDGKNFQSFFTDTGRYALPDNDITFLHHNGANVWIGTQNGGLACYDAVADSIVRHPIHVAGEEEERVHVTHIADADEGALWITFKQSGLIAGGLVRYDPASREFEALDNTLSKDLLNVIYQDPEDDDVLWMGGFSMYKFQKSTRQFTEYSLDLGHKYVSVIYDIEEGTNDTLLVSVRGNGIWTLDKKSGKWGPANASELDIGNIYEIKKEEPGRYLITSSGMGLGYFITSPEGNSFRFFDRSHNIGAFRTPRSAYSTFRHTDGSIYVATARGLHIYYPSLQKVRHPAPDPFRYERSSHLLNQPVSSKESQFLYVPSYGRKGIFKVNKLRPTDEASLILPEEGQLLCFESDKVSDGYVFLDLQALFHLDPETERIRKLLDTGIFPENLSFNTMMVDDKGTIWLGSKDNYFAAYDPATEEHRIYELEPGRGTDSINNYIIYEFTQDESGLMYAATRVGLYEINPANGTAQPLTATMPELKIPQRVVPFSIQSITAGVVAVGTYGDGLYVLNTNERTFTSVASPDDRNLNIGELALDDSARVWGVTQRGVVMYDHRSDFYRRFTSLDGFRWNNLGQREIQNGRDGNMYLAYRSHLGVFDPDELVRSEPPPIVRFGKLEIFNQEEKLSANINSGQAIRLSHDQNVITITFSGVGQVRGMDVTYSYMLENYDQDWSTTTNESVTYPKLPAGDYEFQVRSSIDGINWSPVSKLNIRKATPIYQRPWFILLLAALVIGILYRLYRYRLEQIRSAQQLHTRIAEIEMQALRAQMNPHFLFNSLNSIKNYITTREPRVAANYLNKFAKLIRLILNNSKERLISLEQELQALRLYVDLEAMRLNQSFEYHFEIDPSLELNYIEIPPLVLQPYVENAIWHGLRHRKTGGVLEISVVRSGQQIQCTIKDNGIGRKEAGRLKANRTIENKSLGTNITEDRINMINRLYNMDASIKTDDLYDSEGNPCGTQVVLKLPIV